MGAPYTPVTVLNYNLNPPADDGTVVPSNRIDWSKHKTKIGDPLKTAIESIDTGLTTAFAKMIGGGGITSTAISYGVSGSDQGKLVVASAAGVTITTPDATSVGAPFVFGVLNSSAGDVTLDGSGTQTINGSLSLTMAAGDGWLVFTDGTNWFVIGKKDGSMPRNGRSGCILSNGTDTTNDINIAPGKWRDSTDTVDIVVATALGKQLDANWAVGGTTGTPLGMRNHAVSIANGTYHLYLGRTAASSAGDVFAYAGVAGTDPDSAASIATMLTAWQAETGGGSYIYARRIGSIVRASAAILQFNQYDDEFWYKTPLLDIDVTAETTSETFRTLGSIPLGIKVQHIGNWAFLNAGGGFDYISALDATNSAPSQTAAPLGNIGTAANAMVMGQIRVWTDTSAQVRTRALGSSTTLRCATVGYKDMLGRNT